MTHILLIDDDVDFREVAALIIEERGYEVTQASSAQEAFSLLLQDETFDAVISDLMLPFSGETNNSSSVFSFEVGVRLLRELHEAVPHLPLVALSSASQSDLNRIAKYMNPIRAFQKPTQRIEFVGIVEELLAPGRPVFQ